MKNRYLVYAALWLFVAGVVLLYDSCYGPSINADQPQSADENSTFTTAVTVTQGSDESRGSQEVLTKLEIEIPDALMYNPSDTNWLFFSIMLPDGWTVADNIPFTGDASGVFAWSSSLSAEMENINPAEPGYYWWVSKNIDPITVSSGIIEFSPQITTNDDPGTYWLDYTIGYDQGSGPVLLYNGDYNNMIGAGLEDTVYVTSLCNSGPGTLRDAVDIVSPGGYIMFDLSFPCCLTISEEIFIFKDLHIEGPGKNLLTISSNFSDRVFNVNSGLEIHISGLSIANSGGPNIDGGAIYTSYSTSLHMDNVLIQGCQAGSGGAIYARGSIVLDNVDIKFNSSNYGGGLYLRGQANLTNCLVSGNTANYSAGGIYSESSLLYMDNVNIEENTTNGFGGGLYISYSSTVSLYDSRIAHNNAENGGGIYFASDMLELSKTNITENIAEEMGGGIYFSSGEVSFDDVDLCNIYCNEAFMGFDLYASGSFSSDPVEVTIDGFSVMHPNDYWAFPFSAFVFDIQSSIYTQYNMNLYVSPDGSDKNNGTNESQPFKTLKRALSMLYTTSSSPNGINLAAGTYSEAATGETFPLYLRNYVTISGPETWDAIIDTDGEDLFSLLDGLNAITIENLEVNNPRSGLDMQDSEITLNNIEFNGIYQPNIDCIQAEGGSLYLNNVSIKGFRKGILSDGTYLSLHDCEISENRNGISASGGSIYIYDTEICSNSPEGGIAAQSYSNIRIYDSNISGNGSWCGGGVNCSGESSLRLYSTNICQNEASEMGGGIFLENSGVSFYYDEPRCNLYGNTAPLGSEIACTDQYYYNTHYVVVDTFAVLYPNSYYSYPVNKFSFDILHAIETQYDQDLFVSTAGSDDNTGTTPGDPLKSISKAMRSIVSNSEPHTVFLEGGTYSPLSTGDNFPILLQDKIGLSGNPDSTTVIDAEGSSYVLDMHGVTDITISDIIIRGGFNPTSGMWGGEAGGIRLVGSEVSLERVVLEDNTAFYGSGMFIDGSGVNLQDCDICSNASYGDGYGGGIFIKGESEFFTDSLMIKDNLAYYGAGIYITESEILLDSIFLKNNYSNNGYGGGLFCDNADATIDGLYFELNKARFGGAVYIDGCNPIIQNVNIYDNTATYEGGGIAITEGSPLLHNVMIENNQAYYYGGGISIQDGSGPLLLESVISNNFLSYNSNKGGGVYCSDSQPVFIDGEISGNDSETGAGAYILNSMPVFTDVSFDGNEAEYNGGALYISEASDPFFFECNLTGNTASGSGGGICAYEGTDMYLSDCNISENIAANGGGIAFYNLSTASFDPVDRCNIYQNEAVSKGSDLYSSGCEVINVVIDTFTVIHPTDYFAHKIENFEFDILNYTLEQGAFDLYVSTEGSDDNSGTTPEEPLLTVKKALKKILADTIPPHRIFLEQGIYSQATTGEQFPLNIRPNMELLGSGSGLTVLDGDSLQIMTAGNIDYFLLSGMSLVNGYASEGGAVWASGSGITIEDVEISNCHAYRGGGVYLLDGCSLELSNVTIQHNEARYGGAFYCKGNNYITGNNAVIKENYATSTAGGLYFYNNDGLVRSLRISHNESKFGGGIYMSNSSPEIFNVVIDNNTSSRGSGIYSISNSNPVIKYSTIVDNVAEYLTGGIYSTYSSSLKVQNSIVWNNSVYQFRLGSCDLTVDHCNIMGGMDSIYISGSGTINWLEGNIDEDPAFIGMGEHPYILSAVSPCVDACAHSTIPAQKIYPWDLLGNPRCVDGNGDDTVRTDMGPYEFQGLLEDQLAGTSENHFTISEFDLKCFPNPVRSQAHITYRIPYHAFVNVEIYDASGLKVGTLLQSSEPAGEQRLEWNARELSPGIYLLRISVGNRFETAKVVVSY